MTATRLFPSTRLRRNRTNYNVRALISETKLSIDDLIYPLFVCDKGELEGSIPNFYQTKRYNLEEINKEVSESYALGIKAIMLFGVVDSNLKDKLGTNALCEDNIVALACKQLRDLFPDLIIITDVALDPYTSHGHDGILDETGNVDNDKTNEILAKQAVILAKAGADTVAPSDMMDGRVGLIRQSLDKAGFNQTRIMSYTAKYASNLYGPFRSAVASSKKLKGDKLGYQMDYRNSDQALTEAAMDINEGADWLIVKPGVYYLDILYRIKQTFKQPTFAYQVSGEFQMLALGAKSGIFEFDPALLESLIAFKRAGADGVITYGAKIIAKLLSLDKI